MRRELKDTRSRMKSRGLPPAAFMPGSEAERNVVGRKATLLVRARYSGAGRGVNGGGVLKGFEKE